MISVDTISMFPGATYICCSLRNFNHHVLAPLVLTWIRLDDGSMIPG